MNHNFDLFRNLFWLLSLVFILSQFFQEQFPGYFDLFARITGAGFALFAVPYSIEHMQKQKKTAFIWQFAGALVTISIVTACITATSTIFSFSLTDNRLFIAGIFVLFAAYVGAQFAEQIRIQSFEKVKTQDNAHVAQSRIFIPDLTAIEDSRFFELARSGLFDHSLIIPSFLIHELQVQSESSDENIKHRAKKCIDNLKRLEELDHLEMQILDFRYSDLDDIAYRLAKAAHEHHAIIVVSEQSPLKAEEKDISILSLEGLAAVLKPIAHRGETLSIKIQRLGKEPKQGVGYLEDGTMVVVNGGGLHLGQTIRTLVLSQKYSSSGKIIFCNAVVEDNPDSSYAQSSSNTTNAYDNDNRWNRG